MTSQATRTEHDSMGPVELPEDALFGAQTQRAIDNFTLSRDPLPWSFLVAVLQIKKAAATVNQELGLLDTERASAIISSCYTLLQGEHRSQFPVPVFQTGSGTSTNMNVNEVIAHLSGSDVHPNDHVNLGQSSNDVIPTALHLSTARNLDSQLLPALRHLILNIRNKAGEYRHVIKTGRTHLMDALPIRLEAEFEAWAQQLAECEERIEQCLPRICRLPLGGTAVGSGVNCHPRFPEKTINLLSSDIGLACTEAPSRYKGLSSMDTPLEVSGHLKTLAICLLKISNDLRWMNSGPLTGLGEVSLPALQPGSSIMPAKVNPVIPEAVCMAAAQVVGYDTAITLGAGSGNFQLNVMLPLIASNLLHGIELLHGSCLSLADKAISRLRVNTKRCAELLEKNPILVTSLNPEIGYSRAAELGKIAARENRSIMDVALEYTDIPEDRLRKLLDPGNMADGNSR